MDDEIADHEALRREIRGKYRDVAVDPDRSFEFCTGRGVLVTTDPSAPLRRPVS